MMTASCDVALKNDWIFFPSGSVVVEKIHVEKISHNLHIFSPEIAS